MTISYLDTGRAKQKRRTRRALVEAAAELVRGGEVPTVADAAEAADVSRATAYRYFPSQDALLAEVGIQGAASSAAELMGAAADSRDVRERLDAAVDTLTEFMVRNDRALRLMLRVSLEGGDDVPRRQGRRADYLEEVLAPLRGRIDDARLRRINAAIGMVIGTEAVVVLRDIYGADGEDARALMRWAAAALLRAALEDGGPPPGPPKDGSRAGASR